MQQGKDGSVPMMLFNFKLDGETVGELKHYAQCTGVSVSEYLRRLIDADKHTRNAVLSGAVVISRTSQTTSGELVNYSRF